MVWGQDHTDRPGHSPSSRPHFTACVAPRLGGRESWGLLTHGITAEPQHLLLWVEVMRTEGNRRQHPACLTSSCWSTTVTPFSW